jgi:catechol 2,3-dioxygenase-like lactoylglutathione lyase family enzyme
MSIDQQGTELRNYDEPVVNHVGQCTTDLDQAQRFYELLGFELDRDLSLPDEAVSALLGVEPPVGFTARYLRRGSFQLELMHFDRPGNPAAADRVFNEPGLTHLSISVPDLDAVAAQVEQLGGTIVTRLPLALLVRDPDGQLLELLPMDYRRRIDAARAGR